MMTSRVLCLSLILSAGLTSVSRAQYPRAEDVSSPEAIVEAAYKALERAPGENFQWDRFSSLFLENALLLPNAEQTGGVDQVLTPQGFIDWIDGVYEDSGYIGSANDQGFAEESVRNEVTRYGDIAQVFSTYQKHYYGQDDILGRGINSFQLVHRDGRWWIVSIAWDEENGAGPIPDEFLN